jgi:hypothetical protein
MIKHVETNPEYHGISLIIGNFHGDSGSYQREISTWPISINDLCIKLWEQLVDALKDTPDFVYFGIQNEPWSDYGLETWLTYTAPP